MSTFFQLSTTFWMIFIAESLGGGSYLLGISLVGVLIIIRLLTQTILDYPTGAIGDWIGQRWIIASALVCYGIGYWLTSTLTTSTPFIIYVLIYFLMGVGASQESGALPAWFDNNYRIAMPQDKDRKQYGIFWARAGMFFQIVATLVLIPGSILAVLFGRPWVFQVQAVMSIILAVVTLIIIRDLPGVRETKSERPSIREYGSLLVDGVKFLGSSGFVFFTILGQIVIWGTGFVWWELLLFPTYFAYLLSDVAVSTFRTSLFLPMAVTNERSGVWSRRFDPVKWIPRFRFLQFCSFTFYIGLALIMFLFPPPVDTVLLITLYFPFTTMPFMQLPLVSIIPIILLAGVFMFGHIVSSFADLLMGRVMLDVIPNRIRNSMYSLQPTLAIMIAIPLILVLSNILPVSYPLTFALCAFVALIGALLIRKGFSYPIPKAEDTKPASEPEEIRKEPEAIEEPLPLITPEHEIPATQEAEPKPLLKAANKSEEPLE
jgi:MFS family permease